MSDFRAWETRNLIKFAQEANARLQEIETMKTHAPKVRERLIAKPDGMTLVELHDATGVRKDTLRNCLEGMPDVYIDRWEGPYRGQWAAVYCIHLAPPNCPRPDHA
jgi:hypothetical protein